MIPEQRILIVVTSHAGHLPNRKSGYWLGEVTHFFHVARETGIQVDFASPLGGRPPLDEKSLSAFDRINKAFVNDAQTMSRLDHTQRVAVVDPDAYTAIYYAGGHGAMWDFPDDPALARLSASIYARGGVVASVCHGAAGLLPIRDGAGAPLIAGKTVTGFSNTEEKLIGLTRAVPYLLQDELAKHGRYDSSWPFLPHVVVSDRVVTGQNPASTKATARAVVKLLTRAPVAAASEAT
jgi:putative intracellular protease/amidase